MCVPNDDWDCYIGTAVEVPTKGLGSSKAVALARKGDGAYNVMTFLEIRGGN